MKTADNPTERATREPMPLRQARQCGARTRAGNLCRSKAANGKGRCRLHGGAKGSGAPKGQRNGMYRHGRFTAQARAERRLVRELIREARATVRAISRAPFSIAD